MPTYQYACTACEHRFEAVQSFTDSSLTECPECSGKLRKLFGAVGVVFKGSGFYRTDNRSSTGKGTASTSSETKTETKTETKKTESKTTESKTTTAAPAAS